MDQDLPQLEWVPLEFRYRFSCDESRCTKRDLALRDWEAGESYRKFLRQYGQQGVEQKPREHWFTRMFTSGRAVHHFVGNFANRPVL
ncbi:hypothetical protein [Streptomyces sp. NPDC048527]|uniref:hypothetical protein n=1 Tax=Streptomyces sp. NPDC048527 TaxID=3365568 RepID=UPI003716939F